MLLGIEIFHKSHILIILYNYIIPNLENGTRFYSIWITLNVLKKDKDAYFACFQIAKGNRIQLVIIFTY